MQERQVRALRAELRGKATARGRVKPGLPVAFVDRATNGAAGRRPHRAVFSDWPDGWAVRNMLFSNVFY